MTMKYSHGSYRCYQVFRPFFNFVKRVLMHTLDLETLMGKGKSKKRVTTVIGNSQRSYFRVVETIAIIPYDYETRTRSQSICRNALGEFK